ncbi:MAG: hypothetical protein K1Y02_26675, partial [Candidatus Hydrogenedentes bacterium]|nr:hypothetical protein [Candidatus Hydrogenedentota bacterium]
MRRTQVIRRARRIAFGAGLVFLLALMPLTAFAQVSDPNTGSATTPESTTAKPAGSAPVRQEPQYRPAVDLRTLFQRESHNPDRAPLSVKGRKDGTIEVRDRHGELIEIYPSGTFALSGRISPEAIERINSQRATGQEAFAERKAAEQEAAKQQMEADKAADAAATKEAEDKDAKWNADLASKSDAYKTGSIEGIG